MYVDIHCHLLPGVDDGVKDLTESLACLEMARREKVTALCVTPHIWREKYPNRPAALREAFAAWKPRAAELGLEVHLGSEVMFHPRLAGDFEAGDLLAMGAPGRYLLVELPLLLFPQGVAQGLYDLGLAGAEPILAHPERYPYVASSPDKLRAMAEGGVHLQVTTHSVAGLFGTGVQRAAFELLERGWVSLVASDAHSPRARAPMFRQAVRVLWKRYGRAAARLLCLENPRRVLEGRPLLPVACSRARRRRNP